MKEWILAKKFYLFSLVIVLSLLLVIYFVFLKKADASGSVFDDVTFIGHGLYGVDGVYTDFLS